MDEMTELTPAPKGNRRSVMLGAVFGAVALTGTIVGVSTVAGAQDEPTMASHETSESDVDAPGHQLLIEGDEDWAPFEECIDEQLGDHVEPDFDVEPTEEEWAALDAAWEAADAACNDLLPDEVKEDMAAWEPFEECIDSQLGELPEPDFDSEPTEEEWSALDAAWEAADAACADLLPEDAQAEMAAFDAFDQCLADAGVFDENFGPAVHIETDSGFQVVEFGDVTGSVTITGDADGVSIDTDGGVVVLDEAALDAEWEAIDEAHSACEDLLPEDSFGDDFFFDDEVFED